MKKIILILLLYFIYSDFIKGQSMMTNRNVYDFNINDEFHSKTLNILPNVTRIKIIAKHFSVNNDTVFYTRSFNNYFSYVAYNPNPYLVYVFSNGIDSVFYSDLDSTIQWSSMTWQVDSCNPYSDTLFYSSEFCGAESYEYNGCTGCCFEGSYLNEIFGKGLGLMYHYSYQPINVLQEKKMIYFKKDTIVCGMPDTTSPNSVEELINAGTNTISLFPNPATNELRVYWSEFKVESIEIYDVLLQKILSEQFQTSNYKSQTINISVLTPGMYFLRAKTETHEITRKFIKE